MNWSKYIALALSVLLVLNNVTLVSQAATYSDVPSWATDNVKRVSDEGLMVGDSNGKFNPYNKVSHFDLVDVLARMSGYKNPNTDPNTTTEEKNYIKNAYLVNKWVIDTYSKNKSKWQHSQDEKIAYLLQKGIIDQADLSVYVTKSGDTEKYGYVTKEALCKYLVRVLDLEKEALSLGDGTSFKDDSSINAMYKPYVAMLKEKELISGGSDNKFSPTQEVTRVILAVFISNVLEYDGSSNTDSGNTTTPTQPVDTGLQKVAGKVAEVYDFKGTNVVKVMITDSNSAMYIAEKDVKVYKNDQRVTGNPSDIAKKHDNITIYINSDNKIEKMYLGSTSGTGTTPVVTPNPTDTTNVSFDELTGVITSIDQKSGGYQVSLKVQYVTFGETKEVTKAYMLDSSASIIVNDEQVTITNVDEGSVATVKVHNGYIYSIEALSKNSTLEGKVVAKEMYQDKYAIKIEDKLGEVRTYQMSSDTKITKKGVKKPSFNSIAIGNTVIIETEYDKVLEINCSTEYNTYTGYVELIEISKSPKLTIKGEDGLIHKLSFSHDASLYDDDNTIDIYDLKLGFEVEVSVDGDEIYTLKLENKVFQNTLEGEILDVKDNGKIIVVQVKSDDISGQYYLKNINVEYSTKIYKNGVSISRSSLDDEMRVIITLDKNNNSEADVIYVFE